MQGPDRRRWVAGRPGRGQITTRADPRGRQSNSGSHAPAGQALTFSTSKSVAKTPIASGGAKRIVGIPRFSSRSIPARSAFATDLDRPPSEPVPGVPCVSAGSHPVRLGDDGGGKWRSGRIVPAPTRQCRRKNRGIMREPPSASGAVVRTILPERHFSPPAPGESGGEAAEASPGPAPGGTGEGSVPGRGG